MEPIIRRIVDHDTQALASIHAASWRSAYRGMLQDSFLDQDLLRNRLSLWGKRLAPIPHGHFGYLALQAGTPIGFAFAFGAHDPHWGTQIDNLHVLPDFTGRGIGRQLLRSLAEQAFATHPDTGMYLWVYEQNARARRFYAGLGGEPVERAIIQAPGGGPVAEWRYVWQHATSLVQALRD
jgi:ribosomal protein S18 acetylase RimI-like enzyme